MVDFITVDILKIIALCFLVLVFLYMLIDLRRSKIRNKLLKQLAHYTEMTMVMGALDNALTMKAFKTENKPSESSLKDVVDKAKADVKAKVKDTSKVSKNETV